MEDSFLLYNLPISAYDFFFNHIRNFHFLTNGKDITNSLRLRSTTSITTLTFWGHYYGKQGLSEHKHCNNAATNSNSENARSRMVERLRGSVVWVQRREMSQVLGAFGLLYFTTLRPVLAWRTFWNLRTVYFFNFPYFFSGRGKTRITEIADTGVRLYIKVEPHDIFPLDWWARRRYCRWLQISEVRGFLVPEFVFLSDEAWFTLNGSLCSWYRAS